MGDGDFCLCLYLRETVVKLDGLAFCNLDEGLNALLAKRHQLVGCKATAEAFGAREADAGDFVALSVEQVDTGEAEHSGKLVLVTALVVMIAEDRDDGNANVFEHAKNGAHLLRHAVVCKVAGYDQYVSKIVDRRELVDIALVIFCNEMDVGNCCEPHSLLLVVLISCRGCG